MFVLILIYGYIFILTIGIGIIISKLLFTKNIEIPLDLLSLLGFIILSSSLNIIHLFMPLGGVGLHLFLILILSFFSKTILEKLNKNSFEEYNSLLTPSVFLLFFTILIVSSIEPLMVDSLGYHAQILRWFGDYAVVPGLANLHERLAFQSVVFPSMTFFDFSFLNGQLFFPVNSYFNFLVLARLIIEIRLDIARRHYGFVFFEWFFVMLNLYFIFGTFLSSPTPDYLASILVFYVFLVLKYKTFGNDFKVLLILFCLFMPLIKLGQLFFAFLPLLVIRQKRHFVLYVFSGIIFIIPYFLHNYIQSGYLFYPSSSFNYFNPDWKLPLSMTDEVKNWILSWARNSNMHYSQVLSKPFHEWFTDWFLRKSFMQKTILIAAALSPFISLGLWKKKKLINDWFYFGIICWLSIIFWVLTAPELRFGFGFIGAAALLPFLAFEFKNISIPYKFSHLSLILTLSLIFAHYPVLKLVKWKNNNFIFPERMPDRETTELNCVNFKVHIPLKKQGCSCEMLPCASHHNPELQKRGETFSEGFSIKNK
jgi:hypothetical protein